MSRLLLVVPTLAPCGAAHEALLLATELTQAGMAVHLCALAAAGEGGANSNAPAVPVTYLGWRNRWHLPGLWRLQQLLRDFQPTTIHAWKLPPLRAVRTVLGRRRPRLLVSRPLHLQARSASLSWLDRWLLAGVDGILVRTPGEGERLRSLGAPAHLVQIVPPGIPKLDMEPRSSTERVILGIGPLEERKGFREAIWAFDALGCMNGADRLVLAGAGPYESELRRFMSELHLEARIRFTGIIGAVRKLLNQARVVWVPSLAPGGVHAALEAQRAGVPVVASALPELAEVVRDGETGLLVPPGDGIALARQTLRLFEDSALHARLGAAGRAWVREHFNPQVFVAEMMRVYEMARGA